MINTITQRMSTKVVYEHILEAKELTKDEYWRDIIDNCARNRFPKGAKYNHNKNMLYVRSDVTGRVRNETITLPLDVKKCYETLMHVLKNLLGLKSDDDIKQSKQDIETARKKNDIDLDCEWKKLKPRTIKNHILMNYAISQIDEYGLTDKDVSKLYRLIQLGMQFKYLSSEDFQYENGVVHSVKGLEYNKKEGFFAFTNKRGPITHASPNKSSYDVLEKSIDRWVKEYNTHINIKV